ncbi:MAG: VWA domain-containing protein [Candidatus Bipolaricaulota bacterium]|nr:VWA domain-containing protein [Candidatus Bipolaricaulota bacterium]
MTFAHPAAFALLSAWLLVVFLAVLQTRQRRREVGALFLWQDLHGSPTARTRNLRFLLDPLLLLRLACVLAFALALAQPEWVVRRPSLGSLAVVIDGSASMRTTTDGGRPRYADAVDRALELLADTYARSVAVVQWTSAPVVLAAGGSTLTQGRSALRASTATWLGDGTGADLARTLSAVGGPTRFERIVVLTDHPIESPPFPVETALVSGGENVAITAFTVRPNVDGTGVSAFVELRNDTGDFQDARLQVGDEFRKTSLDAFLEPGETAPYVVPFPGSRGSRFTAALDVPDDYSGDNVRYFSLERSIVLRVRWLGAESRFLSAALESVLPVVRVEGDEPADLTVAYDTTLPALPPGHALLVHSSVEGVVTLDAAGSSRGTAAAWTPDHPLLAGVRAEDIFAERMPTVTLSVPANTILGIGTTPLLFEIPDPDRSILALTADLLATNLPITVDFPLLIRTFVSSLVRTETGLVPEWVHVGDPVPLDRAGTAANVLDPNGQPIPLAAGQRAFLPDAPGEYTLVVGEDRYPVSVNVEPSESLPAIDGSASLTGAPLTASPRKSSAAAARQTAALWPALAGIVCVLLVLELALTRRRAQRSGRSA